MKMQILNKELAPNQLTPVLFVFPPIEIPILEDGMVSDEGTSSHYASVVYDIRGGRFAILEFNLKVFHAVASYKQRHNRIKDLEVLLTRHPDGKFKMNIGNTDKVNGLSEKECLTGKEIYDNLIGFYQSQNNYQVHDL